MDEIRLPWRTNPEKALNGWCDRVGLVFTDFRPAAGNGPKGPPYEVDPVRSSCGRAVQDRPVVDRDPESRVWATKHGTNAVGDPFAIILVGSSSTPQVVADTARGLVVPCVVAGSSLRRSHIGYYRKGLVRDAN